APRVVARALLAAAPVAAAAAAVHVEGVLILVEMILLMGGYAALIAMLGLLSLDDLKLLLPTRRDAPLDTQQVIEIEGDST
ncbi:MAG: hypothetical protein ACRELC_01650, partial [Gemmatimonadota bacterium]